ncbi:MAG: alpha/beta fold hydrolase [Alphaproteobacteria bacterium]
MQLDIDGHQTYAATGGRPFDAAKPAAIFIHGAGMDHSYWQLQSRWFAWHDWSVLAVDLPGHGRSGGEPLDTIAGMAAWIGRLMDAAGVGTATLIGHSMGAAVALEAAALLSDRVDRLALLGVSEAIPVHPVLLEAAAANDPKAYDMMTAWGHGAGAKMGRNKVPGIWMLGGARALLARSRPGVLHTGLKACDDWRSGAVAAGRIACPTVAVFATQDVMTPLNKGRELAGRIADCKQVVIRDCGHMMMQEAPDASLDALIGSLQAV